jgi:hypothetical protein
MFGTAGVGVRLRRIEITLTEEATMYIGVSLVGLLLLILLLIWLF